MTCKTCGCSVRVLARGECLECWYATVDEIVSGQPDISSREPDKAPA